MKILAIDTSALVASAALCENDTPIAVYSQKSGLTHSETMLPIIRDLLVNTGWKMDAIDMLAVSHGPGSFTGVRIGISLVKGLAFGKNKICVGVSTLEAMARNLLPFCQDALICPVMDARRGQLYTATFAVHGNTLLRLTPDRLEAAETLASELLEFDKPVYFTGDGYDIMKSFALSYAVDIPKTARWQSGYGVALAALEAYQQKPDPSIFTDTALKPRYLRPSGAERKMEMRSR